MCPTAFSDRRRVGHENETTPLRVLPPLAVNEPLAMFVKSVRRGPYSRVASRGGGGGEGNPRASRKLARTEIDRPYRKAIPISDGTHGVASVDGKGVVVPTRINGLEVFLPLTFVRPARSQPIELRANPFGSAGSGLDRNFSPVFSFYGCFSARPASANHTRKPTTTVVCEPRGYRRAL